MVFEYDFDILKEIVSDAPIERDLSLENEAFMTDPLGQYACRVLSINYEELSSCLASLMCASLENPEEITENAFRDALSEKLGEIGKDAEEVCKVLKSSRGYFNAFQEDNYGFRDILLKWNCSEYDYFFNYFYDIFQFLIALQTYLDESDKYPDMLLPERFEQFVEGALDMKVAKQIISISTSDSSLRSSIYPGCDIGKIVRQSFDSLMTFGDNYVSMSCSSLIEFVISTIYYVFKNGYQFKRCKNCGRFFIPFSRSDEIYCNNISPQDSSRTCKKYGTEKLWYDRIKNDEVAKLSRNIYAAKQMLVKRNPNIKEYKEMFDYYKTEREKWNKLVKCGEKSREEYIEWLNQMKKQKTLKWVK